MSVETIKICKCDICGKVLPKETGHLRWHANLKLGSNIKEANSIIFEDVCDECDGAIRELIDGRSRIKIMQCEDQVNSFTDYL